jgi:ribonuclease HI
MAVEGDINSKNSKTLSLRKLLDEERAKITFLWVTGHMRIPGNEIADEEAKATLKNDLHRKIPNVRSDLTDQNRKQENKKNKMAK